MKAKLLTGFIKFQTKCPWNYKSDMRLQAEGEEAAAAGDEVMALAGTAEETAAAVKIQVRRTHLQLRAKTCLVTGAPGARIKSHRVCFLSVYTGEAPIKAGFGLSCETAQSRS